ncbi:ATP-binding cassette domain-containing protein [Slackia sp.]|uniref:ABC transporter ATP-binding protein/permease n=1 Tax=Slackia sp. TaxID=2049041 RepID=UPI0039996A18
MLELKDIKKDYVSGDATVHALKGVSLQFRDSEFVAILGQSGCGKTTMLNIVGGLDRYTSGDLVINGVSTKEYRDRDWDSYRNHSVGFVFQSYNLIPHQDVLSNVELALTLSGVSKSERRARAVAALEQVGLGDQLHKKPNQMSGGQMQRVAIARALVNNPSIVLADEPTGALDSETSVQVMEILKNVAKDRLVVMVTHNPDLAADYADRIVRFKDGVVMDDSDPYYPTPAECTAARAHAGEARRTSMNPFTALSLSLNNLLTKKGRTLLTAFAGSIGIIGIALILSLSNGVNDYIAKVEQDTLSSYPLTIAKQSYDLTSMLTGDAGSADDSASDATAANDNDSSQESDQQGSIQVFTMLKDMFASVKSNDMTSFKAFLDEGGDGISSEVSAIQYDYGITPLVYRADTTDGAVQLSPNSMTTAMTGGASNAAMAGTGMGATTSFNEMIDNRELLDEQYDVVAGRWAESADECVLVLSSSGKISDYTLYSIGVLDPAELDNLVDSTMNASGEIEVPETEIDFTYEDALNTSFKVLSPSDSYRKNEETGGWTNMADDADFMREKVEGGLDLKIVGVVQPDPAAKSAALTQGIAYTHDLSIALMDRAASSEIVKQQLGSPDIDVFTGKSFDTLQEEAKEGVDLANLFTVDQAAIANAFKFDQSKIGAGLDLSGFDFAGVDLSGVSIDLSGAVDAVDVSSLVSQAPAPDFSSILGGLQDDPVLQPDQLEQVTKLSGDYVQGFMTWLAAYGDGVSPNDPEFGQKIVAKFQEYAATSEAQAIIAKVVEIAGQPVADRLQSVAQEYVSNQLAPYMQSVFTGIMSQVSTQIGVAVSTQLQGSLASAMTQMSSQIGSQLSQTLASNMQNAFTVDAAAFANAIQFNMDAEDLTSLMTNYANASKLTYDNNLITLGYADENDPQSVKIFPVDFEAKERVIASIDKYNSQMEGAGEDDKVILYTDYMGVLMGSVTDIIDMISLVLIAFVSISLVVSSIMIGIITYISVLERTKEIGILRAIGASKGDVSRVFNAETFIIGLAAGVLGIGITMLLNIPMNIVIEQLSGVQSMAAVPPAAAVILIVISVVLTLVGGIIPSRMASKKDPVTALRTE